MHRSRWIALIAAGVLMAAAGAKLFSLPLIVVVADSRSGFGPQMLIGLIGLETGIATALVVSSWYAFWRYLPGACFAVFAAVAIFKAISGAESCGCFGRVIVPPWWTAGLDSALAAGLIAWPPDRPSFLKSQWRPVAVISVVLLTLGAGMWRYPRLHTGAQSRERASLLQVGPVTVLQPAAWVGKAFPLVDEIDVAIDLMRGRYLVVFYQSDCSTCHEALPGYIARAPSASGSQTVLVQIPPHLFENADTEPGVIRGKLSPSREWFATTPVVVLLDGGTVRDAAEGQAAVGRIADWDRGRLVPVH